MPRTLDPAAHALRRDAFVDAAQRLINAKGYEQMSVQDVLDELDTSRGAFYHYFDSKAALLEAVIERMVDGATATFEPIVDDPERPALEKLQAVFTGLGSYKAERRELLVEIMRTWFSDENVMVRDKLRLLIATRLGPLLARIVRQGQAEGTFTATSAEHTAIVLASLIQGANETASRLFVACLTGDVTFDEVRLTLAAYAEAFERVLGLGPGSWPAVDEATLHYWFDQQRSDT
ncbi:MAG TPA: TetR/AcrR family transcriptional regulator [Candidatus Dormibacteraeota bacterium]|nr:TetR/AcrR family transcriptional regulator [Candidatus Dormibacteraeota bacterium]